MLMPREIWKDIPGYEGLYQVSNIGNVRSMNYNKTGKVKRLKKQFGKDGYLQIGLNKDGKRKRYSIHRLVAMAFMPNPNNLPQVNHKDENPSNNCVWNLEWCTNEYNLNYGTRNERAGEALKGNTNSKGRKLSEEHKHKIGEAHKGKKRAPFTEEHRRKLSEAAKRRHKKEVK